MTVGAVIALMFADGINLFTAFDKALMESVPLLIGIVAAFAMCLEGIPVLIARLMKDVQYYGWTWFKKAMLILLILGFAIVLGFSGYVKIKTRNLLFSSVATSNLVNSVGSSMIEGTTGREDAAYLAVTIAMAVLPLATSIMALYLGWLSSDPIKGELKKQRIHIAKVQEQRAVIGAAKAELGSAETRRERLMIRETELYHDALRQLATEEDAENAMAQEAFFQGRSANDITIITAQNTPNAAFTPKSSALVENLEDTPSTSDYAGKRDRVTTIHVPRTN